MTNKEQLKEYIKDKYIVIKDGEWNCIQLYKSIDFNCNWCFIRTQNDGDCSIINELIKELKQDEPELFL